MKSSFDNSFFKWIPDHLTATSGDLLRESLNTVRRINEFGASDNQGNVYAPGCYGNWLAYFATNGYEMETVVDDFTGLPKSIKFVRKEGTLMEQKEVKKPGEYDTKNSPKPGEKKTKKDEPENVETVSLSDVLSESFGKVLVNNEAIHPFDKPLYDQWLKATTPSWKEQLTERELMEVSFAKLYVEKFNHDASGHLAYTVIAILARILEDKEN